MSGLGGRRGRGSTVRRSNANDHSSPGCLSEMDGGQAGRSHAWCRCTPEGEPFITQDFTLFHTHHIRNVDLDHRGQQSGHDGCCRGGHAAASPSPAPISRTQMVRRQSEQVHAAVAAAGGQ